MAAPVPDLKDYAVIGDCRSAALVSLDGSIDWLCFPNFSSPSIFARILDPDRGGAFAVRARDAVRHTRRYIPDTAVLETIVACKEGTASIKDFMPLGDVRALSPMRSIVRVVEGLTGEVTFDIVCDVRPDYGRCAVVPRNGGKLGWTYRWSDSMLALCADTDLAATGSALMGTLRVAAGQRKSIALGFTFRDVGSFPALGHLPARQLADTTTWWQGWTSRCRYDGPYQAEVRRSAITLKLLTYCLSGGMVAAPTTSLPEAIGAPRNWDYRYCWLRDAGLTVRSLVSIGHMDEAGAFLRWMLHTTRLSQPSLRVAYDLYGREIPREKDIAHLAGFRNSRPVRIGNRVTEQYQHDLYGEVLLSADAYTQAGGELDDLEKSLLLGFTKQVMKLWRRPDFGIWEIPDHKRQYTFSKLMCWVALDRTIRMAERGVLNSEDLLPELHVERTAIAEIIERDGFDPVTQTYRRDFDSDITDSSLQIMASVGYKDANDPRVVSTFARIAAELRTGALTYRYQPGSDGLEGREGAFGLCSFWSVEYLARRGELRQAEEDFRELLTYANDVGLYSEEIAPGTGAALGNFPQGFTHIGLINAAQALEQARAGASVNPRSPSC